MKYKLLILSFLISSPVLGQEVITFSKAVNIALQNNVTLEQAKNQQLVLQANKNSRIASLGPSLSANARGWRVIGNQFIEQEGRVINDAATDNFSASLNAEMVLFGGLENQYRLSSSSAALESQIHTIQRTRQDVIRDVANQYLQVLLDQQLLMIATENLQTQQTQLKQINQMVELGSRAPVDSVLQESQVKQAELRLLRAQNRLMNDKLQLAQLLLIDPEEEFALAEPELDDDLLLSNVLSEEEMINMALKNRGDYQSALQSEKTMTYNLKAARSNYFPTLAAFFSTGSFYSNASVSEFSTQFDGNLRTIYGLNLSIPIFNGLQRYSNDVQAKVQNLNAELRTKELNNRIKSQVISAVQNYKDAKLSYQAARTSLEASQLSFKLEEERYNLGATDLVQYALANQNLVQAKSDFATAYYTLGFQEILMKYALGTLTPEDIPN